MGCWDAHLYDKPERKKAGTHKIVDLPRTCNHPGHNPPMHQVFQDGVYEHICPGCGAVQHFTVVNPTY